MPGVSYLRDRRLTQVFFALLAVVYLTVFPYLQAINNPNENTRVYLTMALVEHGTFRLDPIVKRFGWTNDMARVPDPGGGSHYAAVKGPFVSLLGVPIYLGQKALMRLAGRRFPDDKAPPAEAAAWLRATTLTLQGVGVHVPCFLFLVWMERRLRRWSGDLVLRLSAVAAVGLGTNYLAYSFVFVSHAWSCAAAFVALDFIAVERLRARGDPGRATGRGALCAGLLAGLPALLEYQGAFLSVILGFYGLTLFRRPATFGAFAAGAGVHALVMGWFQWRSFGNPLTPGQRMMETQSYAALAHKGFFGFSTPSTEALAGLLFDGAYGLFTTSPWLWLGLVGMGVVLTPRPPLRRYRKGGGEGALPAALPSSAPLSGISGEGRGGEDVGSRRGGEDDGEGRGAQRVLQLRVAAVMLVVLALTVSASSIWRGGWTIGPRYLGAAPALLALLGLASLERAARAWPRGRGVVGAVAVGLAIASFVRGGAIGLVVSTLPESIERPVAQVLLPLIEVRMLPHHVFELLGAGPWAWWFAPLAASGALVVLLVAGSGSAVRLAGRAALAVSVAAVVSVPALRVPADRKDEGPAVRAFFSSIWEPRPSLPAAAGQGRGRP